MPGTRIDGSDPMPHTGDGLQSFQQRQVRMPRSSDDKVFFQNSAFQTVDGSQRIRGQVFV